MEIYTFVTFENDKPVGAESKTLENKEQSKEEAKRILTTQSNLTSLTVFKYEQGQFKWDNKVNKHGMIGTKPVITFVS
ncbi:hypothetical protein [Bacillus toyonensis]|uniref:hypothetical protein n=1 Tax=Bacillus toyonensis TaxID=155322 RepID=UPI000BF2F859|nr:hypothetical protein [Bacillus toyonensis]PGF05033.1 hypothetical protein COM61_00945 [Bacillus toyonensis]